MYYLTFENDVFIDTDLDLKYLKKAIEKIPWKNWLLPSNCLRRR